MEEIPLRPTGEIVRCVPHQAVVRENAESTKLGDCLVNRHISLHIQNIIECINIT